MFSASVLGTTQRRYTNLFKYKKPWKSCRKKWKKLFIRIFNWLKLDDEKKREYLEIVENKHKLKMDSRQEVPEDKKLRPASIQNLNTLPPEGTVIITTDLLSRIEESRMNLTYKKRCLSQETLCRLVLGTSRMHYRKQLNRATSWELLRDSGKKLFIRIFNWLKLDDDEKREYLEMMEIKEELKKVMDSEEEMAKQNNNRTASIPNLDAFPPEGTILIPTNLLSQNELNDDKKRENLETMEIKEELKRQMGSSEDRQEIPKQKETHMIFSQMEIETQKNRTASIPNLDACPPEGTTINPANLLSQSTPNVIDPSPTLCLVTPESSKSSIPNLDACPPSGTTLNTTDLLSRNEENRRKLAYKGTRLTQQMFSTLVLRMSKFHYINLLRYTKSWETSTEPIKKLYIRIFNWLELDDDKKREYLEFIETNLSEKILKQKKHRKKFSEMEIESLEAIFEANRYPTSEERVRIAQEMKLDDVTIIDNWFRKRRFKTTKK
ncbi:hypothetical protein B9Z55_012484 [Caenorhabditis nigoni]|nr:hypothetical protein B9Z55_012484 [Caenorhabditis nigoni]